MLAKIVKSDGAAEISLPVFPVIGGGAAPTHNPDRFTVPEISPLPTFQEQAPTDPSADDAGRTGEPAVQVEDILQNARAEAARIIAQAEADAAAIAEAAGEKATREVFARFDGEVAAKADEVRLQLAQTIEQISALAEDISARHEKDLVGLALQIAKKIVGREVTIDREIALTLVKVSLSKLHNRAAAEVHLNPVDFAFVEAHRERLDFRGALALVEDKSVSPGGCLIHTESGDIDGRIESQFDEIAHGLFS